MLARPAFTRCRTHASAACPCLPAFPAACPCRLPACLQNKVIFNYFPYPWFVSTVHVVVGAAYCILAYLLGAKKASFERPITKDELAAIAGPASMHAIGHVAANLSFAAVAISLTHTVKTLEPAFNVVLSQVRVGGWGAVRGSQAAGMQGAGALAQAAADGSLQKIGRLSAHSRSGMPAVAWRLL